MSQFTNLRFSNVQYRTEHRWDWDFIGQDLDGSLTGQANSVVVFNDSITVDSNCQANPSFKNGISCRLTNTWVRLAFNNIQPSFVVLVNFTDNKNRTIASPFADKRLTHRKGFMVSLQANQDYMIAFDQAMYPTNVSFTGALYGLNPGDYIIFRQLLAKGPDKVEFGSSVVTSNELNSPISANSPSGSWYYQNSTSTLSYIIKNTLTKPLDVNLNLKIIKCRFYRCELPQSPGYKLPVTSRYAFSYNLILQNNHFNIYQILFQIDRPTTNCGQISRHGHLMKDQIGETTWMEPIFNFRKTAQMFSFETLITLLLMFPYQD